MAGGKTDFAVLDAGSVILLQPLTKSARRWVDENVETEDAQYWGPSLAMEPRCAVDILNALEDEGFAIEMGGRDD